MNNTYNLLPFASRLEGWNPPVRAYATDIGIDLQWRPSTDTINSVGIERRIQPGETVMLETNVKLDMPSSMMGLIFSRSGLAKNSVFVANAPGLIDPSYEGEVKVLLFNGGNEPWAIRKRDAIAQLVVMNSPDVVAVYARASRGRGEGGFGSTGR